jgi:hypothetical protein
MERVHQITSHSLQKFTPSISLGYHNTGNDWYWCHLLCSRHLYLASRKIACNCSCITVCGFVVWIPQVVFREKRCDDQLRWHSMHVPLQVSLSDIACTFSCIQYRWSRFAVWERFLRPLSNREGCSSYGSPAQRTAFKRATFICEWLRSSLLTKFLLVNCSGPQCSYARRCLWKAETGSVLLTRFQRNHS